jgi:hypothetical protein
VPWAPGAARSENPWTPHGPNLGRLACDAGGVIYVGKHATQWTDEDPTIRRIDGRGEVAVIAGCNAAAPWNGDKDGGLATECQTFGTISDLLVLPGGGLVVAAGDSQSTGLCYIGPEAADTALGQRMTACLDLARLGQLVPARGFMAELGRNRDQAARAAAELFDLPFKILNQTQTLFISGRVLPRHLQRHVARFILDPAELAVRTDTAMWCLSTCHDYLIKLYEETPLPAPAGLLPDAAEEEPGAAAAGAAGKRQRTGPGPSGAAGPELEPAASGLGLAAL